jgi:hypothetical protein
MPLYTWVVTWRGDSYVHQDRRSNFRGWTEWAKVPPGALAHFSPALQAELYRQPLYAPWESLPNRRNVWRKQLELDGSPFVVTVVQTVG